jgi:hypothetical protein
MKGIFTPKISGHNFVFMQTGEHISLCPSASALRILGVRKGQGAGPLHNSLFHFMAEKQKTLPRALCQMTGGGDVQISVFTIRWRRPLGMEKLAYPCREKRQPETHRVLAAGKVKKEH